MNLRRIADPDPWSSDKGNQISSDNQCNGRTRSGITSAIEPRWLDLGSDLDETYNSIKCTGMVWASSKAGPVCVAGLGPPFGMRPVPAQSASFKLQGTLPLTQRVGGLKSLKQQAPSFKLQASSLTGTV